MRLGKMLVFTGLLIAVVVGLSFTATGYFSGYHNR